MANLVDALLDAIDQLDDGSAVVYMQKHMILATMGFGEVGDRYPVTIENVKAWARLRNYYHEAVRHNHAELANSIGDLLISCTFSLIARCFTSRNSYVLFSKLSERWVTR